MYYILLIIKYLKNFFFLILQNGSVTITQIKDERLQGLAAEFTLSYIFYLEQKKNKFFLNLY